MRIFLLRHTESETNERRVWTGRMDSPLSVRGAATQSEICSRYDYPTGELYFSSPLKRCLDSLRLVYGRTADYVLPEFSECSLGELEGRGYTNLDDDEHYVEWINCRTVCLSGGESFDGFSSRVCGGFLKMVGICGQRGVASVVAVLHGNVMRAILSGFVDSARPHALWRIPNCGGYLFDFVPGMSGSLPYKKIPSFLFE